MLVRLGNGAKPLGERMRLISVTSKFAWTCASLASSIHPAEKLWKGHFSLRTCDRQSFRRYSPDMMQFSSIEQQIIENSGPAPSQLHFQTSILVFWQLHIPCVFSQCLSLSSDWTFLRRSAVTVSTLTIKYPSLQRRLITPHTGGKHFRV